MNDLRSRLDALADDATAHVQLRNPRTAVPRRRSLRAWLAALVASLLAALAVFTGGDLIINTGGDTELRTVETTQTTDSTLPPDETAVTTTPSTSTPDVEGGEDDPPDGTGAEPDGPSTIATRYGDIGPKVAVAPNDRTTGTAGSGCAPGDGLPDGVWMGNVTAFSTTALTVDVVCYETNESNADQPMDFEITDDSTQTRTVPLADGARFFLQTVPPVRSVDDVPTETRAFGDPTSAAAFAGESGDPTPLAWVLVEGGRVTEVYSPPLSSA